MHTGRNLEGLSLGIPVVLAATTYPNTVDEISNVVKRAADWRLSAAQKGEEAMAMVITVCRGRGNIPGKYGVYFLQSNDGGQGYVGMVR